MAGPLKNASNLVFTRSHDIQGAKLSPPRMPKASDLPQKSIEKIPYNQVQPDRNAAFQTKNDKIRGLLPLSSLNGQNKPAKVLEVLFQGVFNGES